MKGKGEKEEWIDKDRRVKGRRTSKRENNGKDNVREH